MSAGYHPVEPKRRHPQPTQGSVGGDGLRHTAPEAGPFWQCPVPTLEGQPRLPRRQSAAPAQLPAPQTAPAQPAQAPAHLEFDPTLASRWGDDFLLRLYVRDLRNEPPLAAGEECEMAWRASFGDDPGRERLVTGNLRLVLQIASDYEGMGLPLSDLVSEGNLGLMRATELFRPTEGVPFWVYASAWIRQHMRRALTRQAWPMRLPAEFSWQHSRLRQAEARLTDGSGREPADDELAAACGLTPEMVRRLRSNGYPRAVSLQSPVSGDNEGEALADTLPDEQNPAPDVATGRRSDCEFVEALLADLKPRERAVLRLRFGLDDGQERTLEEVGSVLGYVRQGIHKIESAALARLRRRTAAVR